MELKTIARTKYRDNYWLVWLTGFNDGFKTLPLRLQKERAYELKNDIQVVLEDEKGTRLGDAVCHYGSYGSSDGLWEIMIDVLPKSNVDSVAGYLEFKDVLKFFDKKINKLNK
jgi:hypothetical protein